MKHPPRLFFPLCVFLGLASVGPAAFGQAVIFDMDAVRHTPSEVTNKDKQKVPVGTAELVEGKFGKAVKFTFIPGTGGFMAGRVKPTADWDRADGFSFWVKGDGSDSFGGIELIDRDDFGLRYGYCFPIDSTDWRKITVRWTDLTPELAGPLVNPNDANDPKAGYAPSRFGNFWFGKWFYWRDFPAHSYAIDQVALEPTIEPQSSADVAPAQTGLTRLRAKLLRHDPITIVTMGDSLSDKRHWSNREALWSELLAADLKKKYGGDVKLVNPAIGGTTLSQNVVLIPRWLKQAPSPDLVVIWFGGNDWDNGVRGPRFGEYLRLAVDRVRRATHGSADLLLLTTCPSHQHWETTRELEQAVQAVAAEKKTAAADPAAEFRKAGTADEALRRTYWAWDKVHLGPKGHEIVKDLVLRAIEAEPAEKP